ncbi:MAG: hypothetical protein AAF752_12930 [Bacteroidota bacterium]
MRRPQPILASGEFYHVYNQGNNRESIYFSVDDYRRFLDTFKLYLGHYVDTFAFCLMGNHFHLLIRVRTAESVYRAASLDGMIEPDVEDPPPINDLVSERFRRFYISYAMYYNRKADRKGSLFLKNFCREHVDTEPYLLYLVYYILSNPQKHGFVSDFRTYEYSSLWETLNGKYSWIERGELLAWFGGAAGLDQFFRTCEAGHARHTFTPPEFDPI